MGDKRLSLDLKGKDDSSSSLDDIVCLLLGTLNDMIDIAPGLFSDEMSTMDQSFTSPANEPLQVQDVET